jgi:ABC-type transport system involved in multi-copper enzyme maturation permease subunit
MTTTTQPINYRPPAADDVTSGSWLTQTWALLVDAYRELNARKLFWITLLLSLLVVLAFAFIGINERGVTIFTAEFPGAWNTNFIPKATFYKFVFTQIAIPWWLGFIASILALISVCSVFPDFISGGSIDLYLSKPVGRLRLFLTKYLTSLLFVALQVLVFAAASFLLIGIKSGAWEFGIFLAVPLVTLFFSYLFCVCVLMGVVTRSALASLLVTILFWLGVFSVHTSEATLLVFKASAEVQLQKQEELIRYYEGVIAKNDELAPGSTTANSGWQTQLANARDELPKIRKNVDQLSWWHALLWRIKAPLPKTAETVDLMGRWLVEDEPLMAADRESRQKREARRAERRTTIGGAATQPTKAEFDPEDHAVVERIGEEMNARTAAYILGTSLGFEAVILGLAAWIFVRRDF